ncbi:hypothetical protein BRADI_1g70800v3 [Brachypodium distachyon]|uniref:Uncharacterized protein n=1 Tax=Brachypodium distachyon TaxID=15368 RepID=I1H8E0_BRADI|nr:hypothetical protein BRADI_1g70800v3 [Brachypodium distachyon]
MKRRYVLALLVFAFVGGNLLLGGSFHARSTVVLAAKSADHVYGTAELNGRGLKETGHALTNRKTRSLQDVRTDDYRPVDPSPRTKASIGAGPIEHGAPVFPYVPRYRPPSGHPEDPDTPPADSAASPGP